ncbi:family 1 glycosylhydrolase [Umezawaea beigongshangensis]|uniref:family 1 glycosylhydrolase n=1 Tax=Umezawaea beigongshangensis TaxID=2780383 RepID=UPI0034D5D1E2
MAEDGRGPTVRDTVTAAPGRVREGQNADVACDHHRRRREDVALLKDQDVDVHRFSIAWSRVRPTGSGPVEPRGPDLCDRLVDALADAGVEPVVTPYHRHTPQPLEDAGGQLVRDTAELFAECAGVTADRLADRVKHGIPLNGPAIVTLLGYAIGLHAPGRTLLHGALPTALPPAHHQNLAHGLAVRSLRAAGAENVGTADDRTPAWAASDSRRGTGRWPTPATRRTTGSTPIRCSPAATPTNSPTACPSWTAIWRRSPHDQRRIDYPAAHAEAARRVGARGCFVWSVIGDVEWAWCCHFAINLGNAFGTPSDRSGRRPYVLLSAGVVAVAALLLVAWRTGTAALIAAPPDVAGCSPCPRWPRSSQARASRVPCPDPGCRGDRGPVSVEEGRCARHRSAGARSRRRAVAPAGAVVSFGWSVAGRRPGSSRSGVRTSRTAGRWAVARPVVSGERQVGAARQWALATARRARVTAPVTVAERWRAGRGARPPTTRWS